MRARQLGIEVGRGRPGPANAITDVAGVRVGFTTLIEGDGPLVIGQGPVRTGLEWIRESGIGTASRVLEPASGGYTVGVLVQPNHGRRERLTVNGAPVGAALNATFVPTPEAETAGAGSIIVVTAMDAPLLSSQCTRLAERASLGFARTGGVGEHWSGDLLLVSRPPTAGRPPARWAPRRPSR